MVFALEAVDLGPAEIGEADDVEIVDSVEDAHHHVDLSGRRGGDHGGEVRLAQGHVAARRAAVAVVELRLRAEREDQRGADAASEQDCGIAAHRRTGDDDALIGRRQFAQELDRGFDPRRLQEAVLEPCVLPWIAHIQHVARQPVRRVVEGEGPGVGGGEDDQERR